MLAVKVQLAKVPHYWFVVCENDCIMLYQHRIRNTVMYQGPNHVYMVRDQWVIDHKPYTHGSGFVLCYNSAQIDGIHVFQDLLTDPGVILLLTQVCVWVSTNNYGFACLSATLLKKLLT